MDFSKTYFLVASTLLYVSLLAGVQASNDFEIKKLVSSIPDAMESLQKSSMSTYNWETKRKILTGLDHIKSLGSPPADSPGVYHFRWVLKRQVPSGPNPVTSPGTPSDSSSIFYSRWGQKRQVPSGPDPVTSPGTPPDSSTIFYSRWGLKRQVPSGPDPVTSPGTPPDSSSIFYSRWGLKRQVPSGPDPMISPGTPPIHSSNMY